MTVSECRESERVMAKPARRCYVCRRCRHEITFANVEVMTERAILYACDCAPGYVMWSKYRHDDGALDALFGENVCPELPYSAPPRPPLSLRPELERERDIFSHALTQIRTAEDFERMCAASRGEGLPDADE